MDAHAAEVSGERGSRHAAVGRRRVEEVGARPRLQSVCRQALRQGGQRKRPGAGVRRFPTALQMVLSVAMAEQMGERSTSAILAYGLEANPSFIRKLMVPLTRDGIIVSTLGRNGSIHLGRPADKITLRDIYLSVIEDKKLWASRPDVPARCVVSANACWYFKSVADEAEQASLNVLARHTVASALEAVKNADTSGCDPVPEMIARFKKAH